MSIPVSTSGGTYAPRNDPDNYQHVRLKLSGSSQKEEFFHYVLGSLDPDYPYAPEYVSNNVASEHECSVCHGRTWYSPTFSRAELLLLAAQVESFSGLGGHLKVKVKRLESAAECDAVEADRHAHAADATGGADAATLGGVELEFTEEDDDILDPQDLTCAEGGDGEEEDFSEAARRLVAGYVN